MADIDSTLRQILSEGGKYDPARADHIRQEIARKYDRKLGIWKIVTWVVLAVDAVGMVGLAALFALTESVKIQIASAAGFLLLFESSIMEKMFYWHLNLRYRLQRDLVELKLQIAKLSDDQSGNGPS